MSKKKIITIIVVSCILFIFNGYAGYSLTKTSKNLFKSSTITKGYYVLFSNGTLYKSPIYFTSDFIAVKPNTYYYRTYDHHIVFYNTNKTI